MSFFTSPRKSPRKHPEPSPSPYKPPKAIWTPDTELALVCSLVELTQKGIWPSYARHLGTITEHFNNAIQMEGFHYTQKQVGKKIDKFKADWKDFSELLDGSVVTGAGWDDVKNTLSLEEHQWDQLKAVYLSISYIITITRDIEK
jgi:hypothetical protein